MKRRVRCSPLVDWFVERHLAAWLCFRACAQADCVGRSAGLHPLARKAPRLMASRRLRLPWLGGFFGATRGERPS
jgi:hypothetical protein